MMHNTMFRFPAKEGRGVRAAAFVLLAVGMAGCGGQSMVLQSCRMGSVELTHAKYSVLPAQIAGSVPAEEFNELSPDEVARRVTDGVAQGMNGRKVESPAEVDPGDRANAVLVATKVTRYEEGSAGARLLLAGLGQMNLYLDISFAAAGTNAIVNRGVMEKNYSGGGMIGASATMSADVLGKVADGVAEGIAKCQEATPQK